MKKRLDVWLVEKGFAPTRSKAQSLIEAGQVFRKDSDQWIPLKKPSIEVNDDSLIEVRRGKGDRFVSRAGLKLEGALDHLAMDVTGWICLDVGQSTGGFTDCLLQRGAAKVIGIDVGHGQLNENLRADPRVRCFEGLNARDLKNDSTVQAAIGNKGVDLIVMDVSFISQSLILPEVTRFAKMEGRLLSLIKPQFEVGPEGLGKGGIVRDPLLLTEVRRKITGLAHDHGWSDLEDFESSILGKDGNKEFFINGIKKRSHLDDVRDASRGLYKP